MAPCTGRMEAKSVSEVDLAGASNTAIGCPPGIPEEGTGQRACMQAVGCDKWMGLVGCGSCV